MKRLPSSIFVGMARGRPTKYSEELANEICEKISQGITLTEILSEEGMPGRTVVYDWLNKYKDFSERFARARELGFDAIAEDTLSIADDGSNDWMERNRDGDITYDLNGEHVQRSRLRVETRLKLLAKWDPKRYGDRMDVTTNGKEMSIPTSMQITIVPPKEADE